jgi:hypothetical protein
MLVRKVGTDCPLTQHSVPEERSTQPHCLENTKNHKMRQTADRLTLGLHDAPFLPCYTLIFLHFFYFISPLTLHFLCTFSHSRYVSCTCAVQHLPIRQFLPHSSLATSTWNFVPSFLVSRQLEQHLFTSSLSEHNRQFPSFIRPLIPLHFETTAANQLYGFFPYRYSVRWLSTCNWQAYCSYRNLFTHISGDGVETHHTCIHYVTVTSMKLFILGPLYDALGICTVTYRSGEWRVTTNWSWFEVGIIFVDVLRINTTNPSHEPNAS